MHTATCICINIYIHFSCAFPSCMRFFFVCRLSPCDLQDKDIWRRLQQIGFFGIPSEKRNKTASFLRGTTSVSYCIHLHARMHACIQIHATACTCVQLDATACPCMQTHAAVWKCMRMLANACMHVFACMNCRVCFIFMNKPVPSNICFPLKLRSGRAQCVAFCRCCRY